MNKIIKNILISLLAIIIATSFGINIYLFVLLKLQRYFQQQGFDIAVNQITKMVKQTGSVQISDTMILVPQTKVETTKK